MALEETLQALLDPELRTVAAAMPRFPTDVEALAVSRAGYVLPEPVADDGAVTCRRLDVPGREGHPAVSVLLYEPAGAKAQRPAILEIHGGGYIFGAAAMSDAQNRRLCADLGVVVAAVDYRLAPEHPAPAALMDCYAAACWLRAEAKALGVDPAAICVLGGSAGGGLAAGLTLLMRDRGEAAFAGQVLIAPMLDDRTGDGELAPGAGAVGWNLANNRFAWRAVLGGGVASHLSAPARADNLAGLPPTFVSVGSLDVFMEEDMAFVRGLVRGGVPSELHVYPGGFHGFARFAPDAAVSRQSVADFTSALARLLRPGAVA